MQNLRDKSGYLSEDTIAAVTTAIGGAISVIRISGNRSFSVLEKLTQSETASKAEPRKLFRAPLYSPQGEALDDALYVRFVQPQSFTGEDVVELHTHGGGFIAQRLLEVLNEYGVRQALPGEFSFRAVRNGKMSLFQAQAVADLISASNDGAVSLALEKMSGAQNQALNHLASELKRLAVLGEIGIDFNDQDIDEVSLPRLQDQLQSPIQILNGLQSSYQRGSRLQDGIRVAFIGLPNAGKSSFFNLLLGEDRSIVSEIAGTTRDVVREHLTLRGKKSTLTLRLEDTAGLRHAHDLVEKIGIERSQKSTQEAELVLLLVDPTSPIEPVLEQWAQLQTYSPRLNQKTIGILTKCDLFPQEKIPTLLEQTHSLGITHWVCTSAQTGDGIEDAVEKIISFCEHWTQRKPGEILLTRMDHHAAVSESLEHLKRAQLAPEIDLFASDIRQALHALAPLIGETVPDDILGKIFSDFCIGK